MSAGTMRQRDPSEKDELIQIAQEAYIWGSPLVQFGEYRRLHAFHYQPANRVVSWLNYIEGFFAPSFEVLYGYVDFELANGPQILSVPKIKGRYYSIQLMDPFFNIVKYISLRTCGTEGGFFAIVGPEWHDALPDGVVPINCPSNRITAYTRIGVLGRDDLSNTVDIIKQLRICSLERYPAGLKGPKARDQRLELFPNYRGDKDGIRFFDKLCIELESTPYEGDESHLAARFLKIGVGPGLQPSESNDKELVDILEGAIPLAQKRIENYDCWRIARNWRYQLGASGKMRDYLLRANLQRHGGGYNIPEEGVLFKCFVGPDDGPLSGEKSYRIYFPKGELPPTDAFWSLSLLDTNGIPVRNTINRFAINSLIGSSWCWPRLLGCRSTP